MYGQVYNRIADQYKNARPQFGPKLYDKIMDYCKKGKDEFKCDLAVDLGCGSGQSTIPLADHFQNIIAIDTSEEQIEKAPKDYSNIEFKVGDARQLDFLADSSVDLATCGVSLHWFEGNEFYQEIKRVLRPGGVLAAYAYQWPKLYPEEANEALQELIKDHLEPYIPSPVRHTYSCYRTIKLPLVDFERITRFSPIYLQWSYDHLIRFVMSTAPAMGYKDADPSGTALDDFSERIKTISKHKADILGSEAEEITLDVAFPVFMVLGRRE